jgi:hypothetical protein
LNMPLISFLIVVLAGCTLVGYDFSKISNIQSISVSLLPFICAALVTVLFTVLLAIASVLQLVGRQQKSRFYDNLCALFKQLAVASLSIAAAVLLLAFSYSQLPVHIPHVSLFESISSLLYKALILLLIGLQFGNFVIGKFSTAMTPAALLWPIQKFKNGINLLMVVPMVSLGWGMIITGSGAWKYTPLVEDPRFAIPGVMLVFLGTYLMSSCWDLNKSE